MNLIAQLGTDDHAAATEALVSLGEGAVTSLCEALNDPSWRIAAGAAFTLGKIGSQEAIAPLMLTLKADRFFVREAVIWALCQIEYAKGIAAFLELLSSNWTNGFDADLVAISEEVIVRNPAESALLLGDFIQEGGSYVAFDAAQKILSRLPEELVIVPLLRMWCFSSGFDDVSGIEGSLHRIGLPAVKPLVNLLLNPPEELKQFDYPELVNRILSDIASVYVADLVVDLVQQDIARTCHEDGEETRQNIHERSSAYVILIRTQPPRHIAKRLLEAAANSLGELENKYVLALLQHWDPNTPHDSYSNIFKPLPYDIFEPILDKYSDYCQDSCSDEELKDAIIRALAEIAELPDGEKDSEPQPLQPKRSLPPMQSGEQIILKMLDRENPLLKTLKGKSAVEVVESLFSQIEKVEGDPEEQLPLFKAMALTGPEAIEPLYRRRSEESACDFNYGYETQSLEALNIPAYRTDALPPLLRAMRQFSEFDDQYKEIWEYLVAIGPVALLGLEDEIRIAHDYYAYGKTEVPLGEKINISSLFDIREEIMEAHNVVLDTSLESFLDDFVQAIQHGDTQYAKRFIATNPDLIHMDINGKKALEIAVTRDESEDIAFYSLRAEMMEMLLKQGADINTQNKEGNTALHLAVLQYCNDRGDKSYEALLCLLQFEPMLSIENNEGQTAWDEAFDRDMDRVCFWLDEAERLQYASKMKIERIEYTLIETDEELEVSDIAAFDWEGKNIALEDNEMTSYRDYFLYRRNYYRGLGDLDDNPAGKLVWNVGMRRIIPAPDPEQL